MSGLDDNPFADPFKDPAVQRAARPSPAEEANPIKMGGGIQPPPPQQHSPKTGYGGTSQTPPRPVQTAVPMNEDELFRQQEELRRREQELLQRQQEFQRQQMGGGGVGGPAQRPPHNWPPLPQFIPLQQPCFYQDIDVEIPVQFQETVRLVYYVYLVYVLASVANVFGAFFYLMADGTIGLLLLAIIQLVIFTPCAFLFWFRPVYKAFRDDSSFNFMMFFLVLFFHTIFCMVQMLGLNYAIGWTVTLHVFGTHWFIALIMLIPTLGFTAAFIGMVFSLIKVHQFYRGAGFSLDKARQEFSNGVMADRNVQNAANHAARAAANHAVNEMVSGRY